MSGVRAGDETRNGAVVTPPTPSSDFGVRFDCAHRKAALALDAVRLNVITSEEAAEVVRACLWMVAE